MKTIYLLIILLPIFVFIGCKTIPAYTSKNINLEQTSTIRGDVDRMGKFDWKRNKVYKIDGLTVKYRMMWKEKETWEQPIVIDSGFHQIEVKTEFSNKLFSIGPYDNFVLIKCTFEAGKDYRIVSEVEEDSVKVYIEDLTTGDRISDIYETEFKPIHVII